MYTYFFLFVCVHVFMLYIIPCILYLIRWFHVNEVCVYIYIYISLNIIDIFVCIFFVNTFWLPYQYYDTWWELVNKPFINHYFHNTLCPILGHQQGYMYYKSDVTFACALLLWKNEYLYYCIVAFIFKNLFL